ncbi:P-loop containing nucleoside triphosphate hydrolase protein [Guyanagaster necrorhizus]|uniref:P-loop containing nucleoside triphosphate hydrolase protein n=1 Tax=Guyanagaster necrorhizus TaxID=856835 RepID=A0A9P8APA5_9AGAR|nr:P-loop containing nucleoside triphosphate hydrolase protein [Guyanagaster necrorhizus MCA 3950]KAG7442611.1 P-loop containing nucleoside triphosphate hydrolase protein [Guyanagaster necrorhizus MCA 3950]
MGAAISAIIPFFLNAIRRSKVKENPTMASISQQYSRVEGDKNESRRVEQLEKEKKEQADKAAREKEAALKANQRSKELQEEAKANEEVMKKVMKSQKEMEAKWKKGVQPVEWPSREQYEMVKQRLYKEGKFHLAIAGKSGTGKSSLINAFRGIWDDEKGSADTDVVESTTDVTPYPDPNSANPFIWFDIPGSGTVNCPDWTYFNDQGLYIFDAIIVLLGDRFTDGDLAILKNCRRYNIPTYIVRSKSDRHIEELFKKKTRRAVEGSDLVGIRDVARKEYLDKTQKTVRDNLMKMDPPLLSQKVYAVSRDTLTLMVREESLGNNAILDEPRLLKDMLRDAYSRRSEKSWRIMQDLIKRGGAELFYYLANSWNAEKSVTIVPPLLS